MVQGHHPKSRPLKHGKNGIVSDLNEKTGTESFHAVQGNTNYLK